MLEKVKVVKTEGTTATVLVERTTACADCGKCMAAKEMLSFEVETENTIGAKCGDYALAEMSLSGVMSASFIMYGIPLACFIIGCVLGIYVLSGFVETDANLVGFVTGALMLALSYLPIRIADKRGKFKQRYTIKLKEIVSGGNI